MGFKDSVTANVIKGKDIYHEPVIWVISVN
jgi:hypothetical protein